MTAGGSRSFDAEEPADAMVARVRASIEQQGTMTAVYDRAGINR
jgi:hypothetical protein